MSLREEGTRIVRAVVRIPSRMNGQVKEQFNGWQRTLWGAQKGLQSYLGDEDCGRGDPESGMTDLLRGGNNELAGVFFGC